jgi:hypothetical protein
MSFISAWVWLFLTLFPLLALERWVHRHLQGIGLLLLRHPDLATMLYAAIFLPGVALHEMSHWLMAKMLGVKTARFSLWPHRQPNGILRLGYVETERVDFIREALIGIAPLITGSAVVVLIGYSRLGVSPLGEAIANGNFNAMIQGLAVTLKSADVLIWLYLIFTVSNSMMPSESDRRAWLPVSVLMVLIAIALYYLGAGPLMVRGIGEPVAAGVRVIASAFSITIGVNVVIPIIWLIEKGLIRVTGLKVNY